MERRVQSDEDFQNDGPPTESVAPADTAPSSPEPSGETKGDKPETLFDAIQEVVKTTNVDDEKKGKEGAEDDPASEKAEEDGQAEEQEETKDEADEDLSDEKEEKAPEDVSPKARKQIRRLLKDRLELRNEVATLKPSAEIGTQLQTFAQSHDLSSDDIVNALHIAATLRRGDYKSFYDMVGPFVRHAQEYLGVVLPEDLRQAVEQRQMTEQAAREFAKTRFDHQRAMIENQRMNDMGRTYVTREVQGTVARAVSSFENQLAANDPDYKARKAGFVQREAAAILQEQYGGTVTSVDDALAIVKRAYDNVNAQLRKITPAPKATARSPGATNSQTPASRPAPKSLMEAVMAGINTGPRAG